MDYDTLTDQVNNTLTTTGETWEPIVGGLDKVSSSAMGFAWGMGKGHVWICQLPCQGNWKQVDLPDSPSIRDVITDDIHVYVLTQHQLSTKSANNVDDWVSINLPDDITKIIGTASYIWGQAGDKKYRLAKPGVTADWRLVEDPTDVKITSASSGHLYGVSSDGKAMVTDESMQSAWSVVPEVGGKYSAIFGDVDQTAIFGIDATNSLQRCMNGKCSGIDTQGYTPQNITIEPDSKKLWMTTTTSGKSGNIFNQAVTTNYADLLKTIQPIDAKRDQAVKEAVSQHSQSTNTETMSKQFDAIKKFLSKVFHLKSLSSHEEDGKILEDNLNSTGTETSILNKVLPFIQQFLIVLALIVMVYAMGDYLGEATHLVALSVLLGGICYISGIYISIK